jgi:hypothetical protein
VELLLVSTWMELKGPEKMLMHLFSCAFSEWKVLMLHMHFFFFPLFDATPPLLFFFFVAPFFGFLASIISLTFRGLTTLFFGSLEDGAWAGTKANGPGAATSFEAQTNFDVLQV